MVQKTTQEKLKVGQKAPDFVAKTLSGESISLGRLSGNLVWLIFYRYPGCPLCNLHLKAVKRREEWFRSQGLSIVAVFESPKEKFVSLKKLPSWIFMVPDPEKQLYQTYQTEKKLSAVFRFSVLISFLRAFLNGFFQGSIDGNISQVPASFLIAEDGILEAIYYGRTIADHIPFDEVDRFIKNRRAGNWPVQNIL